EHNCLMQLCVKPVTECLSLLELEVVPHLGSASSDRADYEVGFGASRDFFGDRSIRRFEREILAAGEEAHERPTLLRDVIADGPAQHGIFAFERVENRALRHSAF